MKDKEAIETLKRVIEKYPLEEDEKEAIGEAIGVLAWTSLAESRIDKLRRTRNEKRDLG